VRNKSLNQHLDRVLSNFNQLESNTDFLDYVSLIYKMRANIEQLEVLLDEHGIEYALSREQAMNRLAKGENILDIYPIK